VRLNKQRLNGQSKKRDENEDGVGVRGSNS
jgi:hypothetical protein